MNTKSKATLILIALFIGGILIGFVIDRTLLEHQRKDRFARMRRPEMMKDAMERIIRPTPEQQGKIDKILGKHLEEMATLRAQFGKEMASAMDSLRAQMDSVLTEDQKERLRESRDRFKDWKMGKPHHEPPPPLEPRVGEF